MSYEHYTRCVDVGSKKYPGNPMVVAVLAALATLVAGGGLTPYTAIPLLLIVIGYCAWWLYDRLICLGGERCAIGLLGVVEPPDKKKGPDKLDTDYSINLVLAPHQYQELPPGYLGAPLPPPPVGKSSKDWAEEKYKEALHRQIADDGLQGGLIKEATTTGDKKTLLGAKRYDFAGYFSTISGWQVNYTWQPYLHCEFEGGGVYKLMRASEAALAFATAAAVVCAIPVVGWIACAVLSAVAALIFLLGLVNALNDHGVPSVLDPATGQTTSDLHPGRDILFVKGDWVFDTAHEGWNEIHPIKLCIRVATAVYPHTDVVDWDRAIAPYLVGLGRWQWDSSNPADLKPIKLDGPPKRDDWTHWVAAWCAQAGLAGSSATRAAQLQAANQWQVHPLVDGCQGSDDQDPHPPR